MKYNLSQSIEILTKTPEVLNVILSGLSDPWISNNEGKETWSPYDVMGHLIHGEKTDWIPRMEIILSDRKDKTFIPFDRFAQYNDSIGKNINELLDEFSVLRAQNIKMLLSENLTSLDLNLKGIHPELGPVTLRQLLSSWVVHDLNHISQIVRVMAYQYQEEVGPWKQYLKIINS